MKIRTIGNEAEAPSIKELKLNGKVYDKNYLIYHDLKKGCVLDFRIDKEPDLKRGTAEAALPYSLSR